MQHKAVQLIALCSALSLLSGCGNALSGGSGGAGGPTALDDDTMPGLVPQARPLVDDLPTPIGFGLVEALSSHHEDADARRIKYTFHGRAAKPRVDRFYANQMPLKGWQLVERKASLGTYTLQFTKDDERCDVRITTALGIARNRTSITVRVEPIDSDSLIPNLNILTD